MRKLNLLYFILGSLFFAGVAYAAPNVIYQYNLLPISNNTYDLGSTSPALQWNNVYTKNLIVSGTCTGCGAGSTYAFPNQLGGGNATSSLTGFSGGILVTASSTFTGTFHLNLSSGGLGIDSNGLVYSGATSTLSTISGTLGVAKGGTGVTSFLQGWLGINDSGAFVSSTSPTVAWLTATSTATSTFMGGVNLGGTDCFAVQGTCLQTFIQGTAAYKQAVSYATNAILSGTPTYANGTNGVGATLTEVGFGALSVDGQAVTLGQRILVKNQADQTTNGVYTVTAVGSGIASYLLTRATDYNQSIDIYAGTTFPVLVGGTANGDSVWTESTTGTIVVGTSNITFIETSVGTAADTFAYPFTQQSQYGVNTSATTTLLQLTNGFTASSTSHIFNFDFGNATGTNALAITGSTTISGAFNSVFSNTLGSTTHTGPTLFLGSATSTGSLAITGSTTITGVLNALGNDNFGAITVTSCTGCTSSTYPFPNQLGGGNATSSLTGFSGGLLATASSTIGGGSQIGGLTTFGGATTTLNAYFASLVGVGTSTPYAQLTVATPSLASGATTNLFVVASSTATASTTLFSIDNRGQLTLTNTISTTTNPLTGVIYPATVQSFTYATSTAWTGTTTIPIEQIILPLTHKGLICKTDAGTLNVNIYATSTISGTMAGGALNASTTNNYNQLNSNNVFARGQSISVDIGTPASSPTKINCTVLKTFNSQ